MKHSHHQQLAPRPLRGRTAELVRDARIAELERKAALMANALAAMIESHKFLLQMIEMLSGKPADDEPERPQNTKH